MSAVRHDLVAAASVLGVPTASRLAQSMRAATLRQSGGVAPFPKSSAEMVVAVGLAGRGDQKRQVFARRGVKHRAQLRMNRNQKLNAGLALFDVEGWPVRCLTDVLPPHADDIGTPLRAVEQEREREARLRADWVIPLKLRDLGVGPTMESVALDSA